LIANSASRILDNLEQRETTIWCTSNRMAQTAPTSAAKLAHVASSISKVIGNLRRIAPKPEAVAGNLPLPAESQPNLCGRFARQQAPRKQLSATQPLRTVTSWPRVGSSPCGSDQLMIWVCNQPRSGSGGTARGRRHAKAHRLSSRNSPRIDEPLGRTHRVYDFT